MENLSITPTFTIIVPTFNQAKYLGTALDSVLSQSFTDWEAVVVNDGSTDGTAAVLEDYAARDSRIRVFHQANGGVAAALNRGLSEARGAWINWLSSDDMFEPNKLQVNYDWIQRFPECNFFFSYFSLLRESTGELTKNDLWGPLPKPEHQILTLFYRNFLSGITICIRREAWEKIGQFDATLYYGQDYDQWLRLLRHNQAIFIPEWLVINRNHAEQGSEAFPEACYFDTARAAIRFINKTPFPDIVPFADLSDASVALDTARLTLELACNASSFLYALGPHPALILRLLEWVTSDSIQNEDLRETLHKRISHCLTTMALADGNGNWEWMWRTLAAVWGNRGSQIVYSPVDPAILGRHEFTSREIGRSSGSSLPLKGYLTRFLGQSDTDIETAESKVSSIVILSRDHSFQSNAIKQEVRYLALRGHQIVVIGRSGAPYEWNDGAPILACDGNDRDILPWMGRVDICLVCDDQGESVWLDADHWHTMNGRKGDHIGIELDRVLQDLSQPPDSPVIDVVFLERVLSGGGAEKVVMDTVAKLDRKKFKVSILTLFDGPPCHDIRSDVEVHCLHPVACAVEQNASVTAMPHWYYRVLKRVYHGVTNERIRGNLRIANRAHRLYQVIKGIKVLARRCWHASPATIVGKIRSAIRFYCQGFKKLYVKQLNPIGSSNVPSISLSATPQATLLACHNTFFCALAAHWPASYALSKYLHHCTNDVVLVTVMEEATTAAWLSRLYCKKLQHIAWLHTMESAYLPKMYPEPGRCEVESWLLSIAAQGASSVILPSQGCRMDLITSFGVDDTRLGVIPNTINIARVRRLSVTPFPLDDGAREPKHFRFVCVARLSSEKNHTLLIRASRLLKDRFVKFEIVLIGGGALESNIKGMIENYDLAEQFQLLGALENPYPDIASSGALILTSDFESFGLVLLEAMVCGTPVIATDCPSGPREVLDGGRFGVLVPHNNEEALASAMQRIIEDEDLRINLIEAGYERVKAFDVRHVTSQWENLIKSKAGDLVPVTIKTKD